ncbi:hypothetical protein JG687_00011910 [Phytophthora cactorum]|uniref:Uncharacterized protein n=1 Tax=Phytophthora cactorum TaxID=29920 RepID=A0A329RU74_9STRA|nr:hypothetical protein JG687_00011910 [Phytophthora cactorum]RAW26678.1 hypothetical protein PC110_g16918 [Phytophthora cactorum]
MSRARSVTAQIWRELVSGRMSGSGAHKLRCQSTTPKRWRLIVRSKSSDPGKKRGVAYDSQRSSALPTNDSGDAENGSDGSDYEGVPPTQAAVDNGGDEGDKNSLGDDLDADGEKDEGEDEEKDGEDPGAGADDSSETGEASVDDSTFGASPKTYRTLPNFGDTHHSDQTSQRAATISVPIRLDGFETTYATWQQFEVAFQQLQRDTFKLFTKRTSIPDAVRNKAIE